ncbi:MAG: DUF5690 family protein [Akkermansiaceae bacterium]|nr:hypothetical protein [Verrucomicrobiales bacterium]HCN80153.1 hypothetical protein [Verrucomicrobiales bacterium]
MNAVQPSTKLTRWTGAAVVAAFMAYYCMYSFRKPFAVLPFDGGWWGGIALKSAIVTAQLIGYVSAKFLGTRVCSGIHRENVFQALMACILVALGSLALLAVLPPKLGVLAMLLNGLSLGMVWGMVMRPLEGRGNSELLIAGLCTSFIVASGDVKSMGQRVLDSAPFQSFFGNDSWMPFATSLIYLVPFTVAAFVLGKVPKPSSQEEESRSPRHSMTRQDRLTFIRNLAAVLVPIAVTYFMLTSFRDYRDNFQANLFLETGVDISATKDAFSTSERIIAFVVVSITGLVILVRHHLAALQISYLVMAVSLLIPALAISLRKSGAIDGMTWMILSGTGTYIPYIIIHCVTFERLVAFTLTPGNAVFAMMLLDGLGYLGPILIIPLGDLIGGESRLATFDYLTYALTFIGVSCMIFCMAVTPRYGGKAIRQTTGHPTLS